MSAERDTGPYRSLPEDAAAAVGAHWQDPNPQRLSRKQRFARGLPVLPAGPSRTVTLPGLPPRRGRRRNLPSPRRRAGPRLGTVGVAGRGPAPFA